MEGDSSNRLRDTSRPMEMTSVFFRRRVRPVNGTSSLRFVFRNRFTGQSIYLEFASKRNTLRNISTINVRIHSAQILKTILQKLTRRPRVHIKVCTYVGSTTGCSIVVSTAKTATDDTDRLLPSRSKKIHRGFHFFGLVVVGPSRAVHCRLRSIYAACVQYMVSIHAHNIYFRAKTRGKETSCRA